MPITRINKMQSGFSLIELAVVLVIIGILIGSFIGTLGSRIDNTRRIETKEALDDIRTTLYGYAMSQSPVRLPCPDTDNNGSEDFDIADPTKCDALTTHGNLPWATLGIARGDAWSSTYSYWVADKYSNTAGFNLTTDATGDGQIEDSSGNVISNNVAVVIFSHGKNQYGSIGLDDSARPAVPAGAAYNDERENQDTDAVAPVLFISRPVTDVSAPVIFDDILAWISEYELKGRMVQAGVLPP